MPAAQNIAKDVAVARRALGLDAAQRRVTAALGSPGSFRRSALSRGLWLLLSNPEAAKTLGKGLSMLSSSEAVKAQRLHAEAQEAAPNPSPQVIVSPPPVTPRLVAVEVPAPNRPERAPSWFEIVSVLLMAAGLIVGIIAL